MELVDMRGLKPRPVWGPGSTPGMGKMINTLCSSTTAQVCNLCSIFEAEAYYSIYTTLSSFRLTVEALLTSQIAHIFFLYLILAIVAYSFYSIL